MEAAADLVNPVGGSNLESELEKLTVNDEIENELKALKTASMEKMEERVEALETILDDTEK